MERHYLERRTPWSGTGISWEITPHLRVLEVSFQGFLNSFQAHAVPIADLRPPPHPSSHLETNSYACREVKIAAPAYVLARLGNLTRLDGIAHP